MSKLFIALAVILGAAIVSIGTIDVYLYLHRGASSTTRAASAPASPSEHTGIVPPVVRPLGGAGTSPYAAPTTRPSVSHPRTTSAAPVRTTSAPTPTDPNGVPLAVLGSPCAPKQAMLRRYDAPGDLLVCDGRSWVRYDPVTSGQTTTSARPSASVTTSASPSLSSTPTSEAATSSTSVTPSMQSTSASNSQ